MHWRPARHLQHVSSRRGGRVRTQRPRSVHRVLEALERAGKAYGRRTRPLRNGPGHCCEDCRRPRRRACQAPGLKRGAIMFNPDTAPVSVYMPHLRPRPGHSRSCQSLRPFMTMWRSKRPSSALGARSCRIHSRSRIAHRSYWRRPDTTCRRCICYLRLPQTAACSLSYGVDPVDTFRRAATYVNRILRGAKPSELPVYCNL
jgi:hypothetical protein